MFHMSVDDCVQTEALLVRILKLLSGPDLKNVRLVNSAFNELVTGHPSLFWEKHAICVNGLFDGSYRTNQVWCQLSENLRRSTEKYPNFHFKNINLNLAGAVKFFQSSALHEMKYLKLSNCDVTPSNLLELLTLVSRTLTELNLNGSYSFIVNREMPEPSGHASSQFQLPLLEILTLSEAGSFDLPRVPHFPTSLLIPLLCGSQCLKQISLLGWNAETGRLLLQLLSAMDPAKMETIVYLEIHTIIDENLTSKEQYSFLELLRSIRVKNLKGMRVTFDKEISYWRNTDEELIGMLTNSIVRFLEGTAPNLETVELINCPVCNDIVRSTAATLERLIHLNLRGSLVTSLDEDGNRVYESTDGVDLCFRTLRRRGTLLMAAGDNNDRVMYGNKFLITRKEIYKLMAAVFAAVTIIHWTLKSVFGTHLGNALEVFVYSAITFIVARGSEISDLWELAQD